MYIKKFHIIKQINGYPPAYALTERMVVFAAFRRPKAHREIQ